MPPSRTGGTRTGWWWNAVSGRLVPYESALERDVLMQLDRDPRIRAYTTQPMRLGWDTRSGHRTRHVEHTPDVFVRHRDGTATVINCRRRAAQIPASEPAVELICAAIGWGYEVRYELDPTIAAGLRWLADYRHPRYNQPRVARALRAAAAGRAPHPLGAVVSAAARRTKMRTESVIPTAFHLLYEGSLWTDLTRLLDWGSIVSTHPTAVRNTTADRSDNRRAP